MGRLSGDVVLVTGGGSGLGLGIARQMLAEGAQLAILELAPEKVAVLQHEFGERALVVQGDVRKTDDILACRDAIQKKFGRLNSLIGAQGIFDGNVPLRDLPVDRLDAAFDELFHTNVLGYIKTAKIFLGMLEKEEGSIVLTASSCASYCADGGGLLYTATKHAVLGVVRQLSFEFAPKVRVNAVAPAGIGGSHLRGPAALGLEAQGQNDIPKDQLTATIKKITTLEWLPEARDYGPLYALLASRDSRVMTGETVVADQGLMNRAILTQR